jgi:hypothetical protein
MGFQVFRPSAGSPCPTAARGAKPTKPNATGYRFVTSGTCESNGFKSIRNLATCKLASIALNKTVRNYLFKNKSNWGTGRPTGCSWHRFGNIEVWGRATGNCNVNGYGGCFCIGPAKPSPSIWTRAVEVTSNAKGIKKNIGKAAFNKLFKACPVVRYFRDQKTYSIYVRKTAVPANFDAYSIFTYKWANASNRNKFDFNLYSNLNDTLRKRNAWTYCNYNDPDVGFPRDCGPRGYVAYRWFTFPGNRFTLPYGSNKVTSGMGFDVFRPSAGRPCPSAAGGVKTCPIEKGFCVKSNGGDQNAGVIKLDSLDGNTAGRQASCLKRCRARQNATGCEVIWNQGNRGCYVHTASIARGNKVVRHMCWVFSKCK